MADKKCLTTTRVKRKQVVKQAFKDVVVATFNVRGMVVQDTKIKYQMKKSYKTDIS